MAKLDKTRYSKQEATRLMEIRRLEKMSNDKKTEYAKRSKPIDFFQNEIVDESRFSHNQNAAFVLGNGLSRSSIEPDELRKYGPIYGCNALYRTFRSDYLVAVDPKMIFEINESGYQNKLNNVWTNSNKRFEELTGFNYFEKAKWKKTLFG